MIRIAHSVAALSLRDVTGILRSACFWVPPEEILW